MSAAQCGWCQPICDPSQVQHFTHASGGGGRHAQEKHMTKKRQSSAGCGISSLEQTSLTLRTVTSRAKNWVSSDSQLSSRLIRLQLILRPDTTLLLFSFFSPSFPLHSFVASSFLPSFLPSFPVSTTFYLSLSVSLSHTHTHRKKGGKNKQENNIDSA